MIKRCIACLLVLAVLNLIIAPHFAFAKSDKGEDTDLSGLFDEPDIGEVAVKALIGLGVILLVMWLVKGIISPSGQPNLPSNGAKGQDQDGKTSPTARDEFITPAGEMVVFRW